MTLDDHIWWPQGRVLLCRPQLYAGFGIPTGTPPYRDNDIRRQEVMRDALMAFTSDCGFTTEVAFWEGEWPRSLIFLKLPPWLPQSAWGTSIEVERLDFRLLLVN